MKISSEQIIHFFDNYFFTPFNWPQTHQKILSLTATIFISIATVGIAPLVVGAIKLIQRFTKISLHIPTSHFFKTHEKIMSIVKNLFQFSPAEVEIGDLRRSNFSKTIQTKILVPFYRKPLPPKEEVFVPVIPELHLTEIQKSKLSKKGMLDVIKLLDLTKEQKIILNNHFGRAHNQIHESVNSISDKKLEEYFFTQHGQSVFLPNDPRGGHGCDHAVRTTLWAAVFGYLYQKYHPQVFLSEKTLLVAEVVTTCHDSGRSSEGTDVYDDISAENTVNVLRELNIHDETIINDAKNAIAEKDNDPLNKAHPKSLIARIVQNADSADFTRIMLTTPSQNMFAFERSLEFLDIFKELKQISQGDENFVLKDGLKYGDFLEELRILLKEKNQIVFETHQKSFREMASDPSRNYYQEILKKITFDAYPNLNYVLSCLHVNYNSSKLMEYADRIRFHGRTIATQCLQKSIEELECFPHSLLRDEIIKKYKKQIQKNQSEKPQGSIAFFTNPLISDIIHNDSIQFDYTTLSLDKIHKIRKQTALLDTSTLDELEFTDLACVYEKIINYCAFNKLDQELSEILLECSQMVLLSKESRIYKTLKSTMLNTTVFLHTSSDIIRRRQIRLQRMDYNNNQSFIETSFEFRNHSRGQFESVIQRLKYCSISGLTIRESNMKFHKMKNDGVFLIDTLMEASPSIIIEKNGFSLEIGTDQNNWNCYNLAILKSPVGSSPDLIQEFLCQIGMPLILCSSRPRDIEKEFFYKALKFRFPNKIFVEQPNKSLEDIYESLSDAEKAIIDNDLTQKSLKQVGNSYFEYVQPECAKELWEAGGRGFLSNIIAPNAQTAAEIIINILKMGLLSTIERSQQGIIGLGTCPTFNMHHGSANQAFTRLLTKKHLNTLNLRQFSYSTSAIFLLFDVQAAERMPYAYPFDCGGMRNPNFQEKKFIIHGFKTLTNVKGLDLIMHRIPLPQLAQKIESTDMFSQGNEVMFEKSLSSKYLKSILVPERMRDGMITLLKIHGIKQINDKPLEDFILNTDRVDLKIFDRKSPE
ncbi:MAG: hypothetical protein P4L16_06105 [Chlamydiales bacterium]|nr:hypothetical protein [Chlamydiales bacterium]